MSASLQCVIKIVFAIFLCSPCGNVCILLVQQFFVCKNVICSELLIALKKKKRLHNKLLNVAVLIHNKTREVFIFKAKF